MNKLCCLLNTDEEYMKRIFTIALPIMIQLFIGISLNLVDSLMIGHLGTEPLVAVGAANEVFYILSISVYGLCSGSCVFISQYWGSGDIQNIRKIIGINYTCICIFISTASVLIWIFSPTLVWIFARETTIIEQGTTYLRIVAWSYLITCLADSISLCSRSIQKLKVTTIIYIVAILINIILNYCLIYGNLGFPEMRVSGAAIATVIARSFQFAGFLIYIYHDRAHPLAASFKELRNFNKSDIKRVLKMSMPVMISEGGWSIANSMYYIAYGLISSKALAGAQIVVIVGKVYQSFFGGFANSAGVLIGEKLGKGNIKEAKADGKLFIKIVFILGILFTIIMFFSSTIIANCYHFNIEVTLMISQSIKVFSLFIMAKMFGYLFVCGILRCAGDTAFCMFVDLGTSWFIAIPAVFTVVYFFNVGLPTAVACVYCAEIVKAVLCFYRFKSGKWIKLAIGNINHNGKEI